MKTISAYSFDLREIVPEVEFKRLRWKAVYWVVDAAGLDPYLVNARDVKNVTGRKKDDTDAMWLQKLHTCGLLLFSA